MLPVPFLTEQRSPLPSADPTPVPSVTGSPQGLGRKGSLPLNLSGSSKLEGARVAVCAHVVLGFPLYSPHSQPTDGYTDSRGDVPSHLVTIAKEGA